MAKTTRSKSPAEQVVELADELGRSMSKPDYVEFMQDLESTFGMQATATQEEIDREEGA